MKVLSTALFEYDSYNRIFTISEDLLENAFDYCTIDGEFLLESLHSSKRVLFRYDGLLALNEYDRPVLCFISDSVLQEPPFVFKIYVFRK